MKKSVLIIPALLAMTLGAGTSLANDHHGIGSMHHGRTFFAPMIKSMDSNNDQKVSKDEFKAALATKINMADANKDKALNVQEFKALVKKEMNDKIAMMKKEGFTDMATKMSTTMMPAMGIMSERMFMKFDKNHDGKLTQDEVTKATDKLFSRLDRNDDGFISKEDEMRNGKHHKGHNGDKHNDDNNNK